MDCEMDTKKVENMKETDNYDKKVTLQIKEEELDIAKKWIQTGEVKVYRETFTEEKTFTIPVIREELVIERRFLDSSTPKDKDIPKEIIRIPISEEQVQFTKHKVALEDVSIYKEQVKEIKHIEETLKKEKAKVKISGSPRVKEE
ncbi:YsnF/AvaK domain-containing protein [Clostridium sp. CX1]|uniref:YsnF/AvaK domain-containing protein n=1 Tax=Clostridium tanneri TaxID=3037988 RepID=A0ABU4JRK8_9CLOT|nr:MULTISPECIES: YsnF/AvaK domain-containing protein [unclassified Clostridium]MCT8975925.1 YsnF/AvaK domain-containing protein [Clostridium sp. CX1]MDW8800780.1 YsnF/AvaK domain-containing protein [Clostridium sp. A1-XYC3]